MLWNSVKAVVTGGASGLGLAVVTRILKSGGKVAIIDIASALKNFSIESNYKAKLEINSDNLITASADVTDEQSVDSAINYITTKINGLNLNVNCAGILFSEKMLSSEHTMNSSDFKRVIDVNLIGTFRLCRVVADKMRYNEQCSDERGVIINTASIAAFDGQIGQVAYSASKGAVASMTLPMARELARHKIRVMCIAPGLFDTSMLKDISAEQKQALIENTLHPNRLGVADEFAQLVQQIVENPMLNGSVIRLDGGLRLLAK